MGLSSKGAQIQANRYTRAEMMAQLLANLTDKNMAKKVQGKRSRNSALFRGRKESGSVIGTAN